MKRAYIYVRVSTDEQAKHGYSIGAQLAFLREYAQKNGYIVIAEYVDEGVSGQKGWKKRPQLSAMMQNLDGVDVILFIKLDRWFRSVKLYYEAQSVLDEHGVSWIAAQEDYETVTSAGKFKVNIMLSIAQAESERTSERIKFVFDAKRAKGESVSGKVAIGYRLVDKKLALDPAGVTVVQDVFSTYIDTQSIVAVQTMLREDHGLSYTYYGIKQILERKLYLGSDTLPAIIDKETFRRAQELRAARSQRKSRPDRTYLFSGIIFCADCGRRMSSCYDAVNEHAYYKCETHYEYGNSRCKHLKFMREDKVEQFAVDHLLDAIDDYNLEASRQFEEIKKAASKKDPAKIKKKMQKLKDLYLEDLISKEVYEHDYLQLQKELDAVALSAPKLIEKQEIEGILTAYQTLSRENKRAFWHRIIRRIDVDSEGNIFFSVSCI